MKYIRTESDKPMISLEQARTFLEKEFSQNITSITAITGDEREQSFGFTVEGRCDYIIRFISRNAIGFEKEEFLYRRLASPIIPMAPVIRVGRWHDYPYIINRRVFGFPLILLPSEEIENYIPVIMTTLNNIHLVNVDDTTGYGLICEEGNAEFPGWRQYLFSCLEDKDVFQRLYRETFLERDLIERLFDQMQFYLDQCPEKRNIIHGNYTLNAILIEGEHVGAVLDWLDARYGDFLYDVAGLDLWVPLFQFASRFHRFYQEQERSIPAYQERLMCYRCHIAIGALRLFAEQGDTQAYQWIRTRIVSLLPKLSDS